MAKKTRKNPHGLTAKQSLVVQDMVEKVKRGKSITPVESTKKFYNTSTDDSARTISSRNMRNADFRLALIEGLHEKRIVGVDSKVENVLDEGLEAMTKEGLIDHNTRLAFVKEINKVAGLYAPQKIEAKRMSLTMDISEKELDDKIEELRKELAL